MAAAGNIGRKGEEKKLFRRHPCRPSRHPCARAGPRSSALARHRIQLLLSSSPQCAVACATDGFEVAVRNLSLVHVLESLANLAQHIGRVVLAVVAVRLLLDAILGKGGQRTEEARTRERCQHVLRGPSRTHTSQPSNLRSPVAAAEQRLRGDKETRR